MKNDESKVDVLFLDIDGVMLPFGHEKYKTSQKNKNDPFCLFPNDTLAALSHIMQRTNAVLILSSTWRARPDFIQQILDSFQDYGQRHGGPLQHVSHFFDTTNVNFHSERQWELYRYLSNNRRTIRAWVALDDEELLEGDVNEVKREEFEGHVIKTDSRIGLTQSDAEEAVRLFQEQIKNPQNKSTKMHTQDTNAQGTWGDIPLPL